MSQLSDGSLRLNQLARIDALITQAQTRGIGPSEQFKIHITEEQATATPDAHHPLFDLSQHDRNILDQIIRLTGQLEHTTSIGELVQMRAQVAQG
ncbi:hypothetical protein AB0H92_32105 [Streptomyces phaeochromogenes]|uniref:hypothetical protein n=1 Tax=Streptomyces phaeochromogenes TaxID=1923 RepID=UPI0033FC72D1